MYEMLEITYLSTTSYKSRAGEDVATFVMDLDPWGPFHVGASSMDH